MKNIKLTLQYDGTNYHGWQIQPNAVTVQETVESAVYEITRETVRLTGCGRTDTGVHAERYTANFMSAANISMDKLPYALNSKLPSDIVCKKAELAEPGFDSKYSAKKKQYTYRIFNSQFPDVFLEKYTWHYKYPLDIKKMQTAAQAFIGTHDFAGFASSGFTVKTTVRTIYSLTVTKEKDIITIDVVGNGFLYNMVRIIAGTLVWIGAGKIAEDTADIIASCDRERAGITAPPQGLFLTEVQY